MLSAMSILPGMWILPPVGKTEPAAGVAKIRDESPGTNDRAGRTVPGTPCQEKGAK